LKSKTKLTIPVDKIPEGIDLCLRNASQFCADAKLVNNESNYNHALGLCLYAIEELGKAELLKLLAFWAKKNGDKTITFERGKPQNFFHERYHSSLGKLGFSRDMNPFYDHRCKLFFARSLLGLATNERLMRSLEGEKFNNFREIIRAYNEKVKDVYEIDVREIGFREVIMYVDYDQEKNEWINGTMQFTQKDVDEMVQDIERAIQLFDKNETYAP
jgi:AbiV family abortive infection protein